MSKKKATRKTVRRTVKRPSRKVIEPISILPLRMCLASDPAAPKKPKPARGLTPVEKGMAAAVYHTHAHLFGI